ncbi:MAG TPA: hypothetical protein DHW14_02505 [Clostridiales bacterium]|nr:hypothetical protein [Clostridiales bacterium]
MNGTARRPGRRRAARRAAAVFLRGVATATLAAGLFASLIFLCVSATLKTTAANPDFILTVIRDSEVLSTVRRDFLDGLVGTLAPTGPEQEALRRALDEAVRLEWLDAQMEHLLRGLAAYLASDEDKLTIELPVVELKVYLLASVRRHMGEEAYLRTARGLQETPDVVDIGPLFDLETLKALRPYWKAAHAAPLAAASAAILFSGLLWLAAGGRSRGAGVVGGVWTAAGLLVMAAAAAVDRAAGTLLPAFVPSALPELGSLRLQDLALSALQGVRSDLAACGVGALVAGMFLLAAPRAVKERRPETPPRERR